jgi:hypothetical protein
MLLTHVWCIGEQAVEFHVPSSEQTCAALFIMSHRTPPGVQLPTHSPFTQAMSTQFTAGPHSPSMHVRKLLLLAHTLWPGAHTPMHAPPEHVMLLQATVCQALLTQVCRSFPLHRWSPELHSTQLCVVLLQTAVAPLHAVLPTQVPLASHVCGVVSPAPPHRVAPGTHSPVQAPLLQTKGHGLGASTNVPVSLHVCGVRLPAPLHRAAPGAHSPVHAPLTQVWFMQAAAAPYVPLAVQVCTPLLWQRVWLGAHSPVHDPLMHVWSTHAAGAPNVPFVPQVCTPLFEHCAVPGTHMPVHMPAEQTKGQSVVFCQEPLPLHV